MIRWFAAPIAVLALCVLALASPPPVLGASLTVNDFGDNLTDQAGTGPGAGIFCTLREALKAARTNAVVNDCGAVAGSAAALDTINVPKNKLNNYTLVAGATDDTGDLDTGAAGAGPLLIQGTGATDSARINANDVDRVLEVGASGVVTLTGLVLQNGTTTGDGGIIKAGASSNLTLNSVSVSNGVAGNGGGVNSEGTLAIDGTTISGNTASATGGGIRITGPLTVLNSRITGNGATGGSGGGISSAGAHASIASGSSISGNTASFAGAWAVGGDAGATSATLTNVTVSGNTATNTPGGFRVNAGDTLTLQSVTMSGNDGAGAVDSILSFGAGATTNLRNTIVNGSGCSSQSGGTITSQGHNIDSSSTCFSAAPGPGDLSNTDPLLGPLALNGGTTENHALLSGSPAIDAGEVIQPPCPANDQRGQSRPKDGDDNGSSVCDVGAYEAPVGTTPAVPTIFHVNDFADNLTEDAGAYPTAGVLCTMREAVKAARENILRDDCATTAGNLSVLDTIEVQKAASGDYDISIAGSGADQGDFDLGGGPVTIRGVGDGTAIVNAHDFTA